MKEKQPTKTVSAKKTEKTAPKKTDASNKVEAKDKKSIETKTTPIESKEKVTKVAAEKKEKSPKKATLAPHTENKTCKITSCKRAYRGKGYCGFHYKKWRHGEYGKARYKTCHDRECRLPMVMNRHGYCEEHYQKFYVKGEAVEKAAPTKNPETKPTEKASTQAA